MQLPVIQGVIDRRILINYHVDPEVIARVLPAPFHPKIINGSSIAGVCLIRLKNERPLFVPPFLGFDSENAAHRIAVTWDENGRQREGVYVPRRDTSSRFNALAGGRLFPGLQHHAKFQVRESADRLEISLQSDDSQTRLSTAGGLATKLSDCSIFSSLSEASSFFEAGSIGYSATESPSRFDGIELCCRSWSVEPLDMDHVQSSFFEDRSKFPKGSIDFDCALLMRNIEHEWRGRENLCCSGIQP